MRRKMMVLALVLAMTTPAAMPIQAAEAETAEKKSGILDAILGEGGILDRLVGEGGLLEGELPEGMDIDGLINTLKEQLSEAGSEANQVVESILEKAKEKYGPAVHDRLKEILMPVLEKLLGEGADLEALEALENADMDKVFAQVGMARELAKDYILEKNADILESGDVQIMDVSNVYEKFGLSEEFPYLTYVIQYNYTEDENHQLHYLCESADLLLMTLHEEEDGSLTSLDEPVVKEENDEAFLQDFCGNVGGTLEDFQATIDFAKAYFPYTLAKYLEEHPEYTGVEYNGEMHTAEELEDIANEQLVVLYPPETESEAQ